MRLSTLTLILALAGLHAVPAAADDSTGKISGEIAIELQNDWAYKSDDRGAMNNNLYTTIEPSATVGIAANWSVFGHAVLESLGSPTKFENRVVENLGLYVEDLYLEYSGDRFGARAGKLNPGFGVAWDITPGLYGSDIAEDYEISERIGVVGDWNVHVGEYGEHTFSLATFFADTTILSESALYGRGDRREEDGGVSNTESFKSFVVSVNGQKMPGLGNLAYHVSYMTQAAGRGNTADEHSVALALNTNFDLGGGVSFEPLVEVVRQNNQGGTAGVDRVYITVAGQVGWKGWNVAASITERETDNPSAANNTDTHFQLSAGYAFDFGLGIDVGWKVSEDSGVETRTLGALASYAIEF